MYRIVYDQIFLASPEFLYKGEKIAGVTIFLKYEIISLETGKEIFFKKDKVLFSKKKNKFFHIQNHINCSFDENELVKIFIDNKKLKELGYRAKVSIYSYNKDKQISECLIEAEDISKEEFFDILKNHKENFNNIDNKPTQSIVYYLIEKR